MRCVALAGTEMDGEPVPLTEAEQAAIALSKAAAARGEFATDEQVRAVGLSIACEASHLLLRRESFGVQQQQFAPVDLAEMRKPGEPKPHQSILVSDDQL